MVGKIPSRDKNPTRTGKLEQGKDTGSPDSMIWLGKFPVVIAGKKLKRKRYRPIFGKPVKSRKLLGESMQTVIQVQLGQISDVPKFKREISQYLSSCSTDVSDGCLFFYGYMDIPSTVDVKVVSNSILLDAYVLEGKDVGMIIFVNRPELGDGYWDEYSQQQDWYDQRLSDISDKILVDNPNLAMFLLNPVIFSEN